MSLSIKHIWKYKCPKCRIGNIFSHPFQLTDPLNMPEVCESCGQKTEPEPGFYYGAMFVSYVISGFSFVGIGFVLLFIYQWTVGSTMWVIIAFAAISYIPLMRMSRSIWYHLMISFNPSAHEEAKEKLLNVNNG